MVIETEGYLDEKGRIHNLTPGKLDPLRKAHAKGDVIRLIFSDELENAHEKAFRLFHVFRDQYAAKEGLDPDYAKVLLKYKYGVTIPYVEGFKPPIDWVDAKFVEVDGGIVYEKSTKIYTADELGRLIEGTVGELNA